MIQNTVDRIRDAALDLFTEKGYGASMKEIAKAAGITAPAIYVHYSSKEELFLHVVDYAIDQYSKHLSDTINQLEDVYNEQQLFTFVKLRILCLKKNGKLHKFLMGISLFPFEPCKEEIVVKLRKGSYMNITKFNRMYHDLVDKKQIKPIGIELFVRSLLTLVNGIVFDALAFQYHLNEEMLNILWSQYWEGIQER
ncbi:TetR/AcrR family transcriptional regulator [Alkaliphilus hydrothermalis]|uniref:AcrR family transcriptional regulator n=1 Tax=Alkaliphilus hydrothermalis TaxID=1482730 RepID=A0ABS2NTZ5_9FIRM|nr:TetR/AcrR family transcriptional regulator [Alkaliphilus hydrothermalis]MBM7616417.1 AcrR family transcriptional regulator [Alkaliphilus hydrothermalis]